MHNDVNKYVEFTNSMTIPLPKNLLEKVIRCTECTEAVITFPDIIKRS